MRLISSVLALALTTTAAMAGDVSPLTAGAPAGVKRAQEMGSGNTWLYVALGAAAIAGIAIAASGDDDAPTPAPPATTTTTV